MSKSPNILWPALGATGILLGAAYGVSTRSYGAEEAALARQQAQVAEARATEVETARNALAERQAALQAELVAANEQNETRATQLSEARDEAEKMRGELEAFMVEMQAAMAAARAAPEGSAPEQAADAPAPVMADAAMADSAAPMRDGGYGLGRVALEPEIAAWDVDVMPDGRGLPVGSGDVFTGEEVFADKCAVCHGDFAEGVDNWPVLAGGFDTLDDKDPVKTVGSYWPYLSTVWDYVHRSMPFGDAQSLEPDEVYAIVAYILYSNDLVDDDFTLSNETFFDVDMYNAEGFVVDDRAEAEYSQWRTEPCMSGCKDSVEITMRASVLDVTPEEEGTEQEANLDEGSGVATEEPQQELAESEASTAETMAETVAVLDAELVAAGEKVFRKCKACHQVGEGAENKSGPQLNGIVGRTFGAVDGFKYSNAFKDANAEGRIWDAEALAAFLEKPKSYLKGTKMSFSGLRKEADQQAVIEYLRSHAQ